ncbi:squalene/phytoene synthase family protein [Aliiroseovarius sp. YM-037]|uniref:squalene/phytoene synthase family protein n=1 Tax=Aliiroseovarius sp. YM-037 TaxID=3341728 RepID=UPI003A80E846
MTLAACAEMVRRGDPDRFLSTMTASPGARAKLFPLYAFNLEVARAPWVTQEPMIAEMRLQFWRDALEEIAAGKPPRAHEVAAPLAEAIRAGEIDTEPLDALVAARRWDIYRDAFEDQAAFDAHIDATAGHLMWSAATALGADVASEPVVRDFSFGAGVAGWLQAVPELEARGRIPLLDGRPDAVVALAQRALSRLKSARAKRGQVACAATPALLAGWRAESVLKAAIADPRRVADGALDQSEFARRWGLLWRGQTGRW